MPRPVITWASIDLAAIRSNFEALKRLLPPRVKVAAVVKAHAYGHGALRVSQALVESGVDMLAVSLLEEVETYGLRSLPQGPPVLCLVPPLPEQAELIHEGVHVLVSSLQQAKALASALQRLNRKAAVHVKLDTGMGRLGPPVEEALDLVRFAAAEPAFDYVGLCSHFATSAPRDPRRTEQLQRFKTFLEQLEKLGLRPPLCHIAASAGIVFEPGSAFDLVRPGLLLYGVLPHEPEGPAPLELQPALSLHSRLVEVKRLKKGTALSYELTHTLQRDSVIGVVPLGYGDGLDFRLSNRGRALVRGRSCPIVGRICMGQTLLDVTEVPDASVGDEVVFLGRQGEEEITVGELAELTGVPRQHVTTTLAASLPRFYRD